MTVILCDKLDRVRVGKRLIGQSITSDCKGKMLQHREQDPGLRSSAYFEYDFQNCFYNLFYFNYVCLWVASYTCAGVYRGQMNRILGPGVSGSCKLSVKCDGEQMHVLGRIIHTLNHLDISPATIWIYFTNSAHLLTVNIYIYTHICPSINTQF